MKRHPSLVLAALACATTFLASTATAREVVKPVERGPLPNRVHVFEDYETDIEKRWWLRGEASKDAPPSASSIDNTRCFKATLTKDFDDKQGDASKSYKAVIFNPVPGPPMGKHTRLAFRAKLKGTGTLRVQLYSLSNGYHRHLVLNDLKQNEWLSLTVDMTRMRRPDGTGGPLSEDERIDDIQFYIDKDADLWIDDIVLYDAGDRGEKRPFPKRVIFTGWFDTGKQGAEWPGTFEIVEHEKPRTWDCAKSVKDERTGRPVLIMGMRGERPLGEANAIRFRYKLTGADGLGVTLSSPATGASSTQTLKGATIGEWAEAELTFKGKEARTGAPVSASEIRFEPTGGDVKTAVLLIDDVLLYEPGEGGATGGDKK